jgi:hypothetical protein
MKDSKVVYEKENIRTRNRNPKVERSDLDFEVERKHIFVKNGDELFDLSGRKDGKADKYVLWNTKDDVAMAVVSSKYHAVEHGTILNSLDEAMENMNIKPIKTRMFATPTRNLMWSDVLIEPKEAIFKDGSDKWNVGISIMHGLDGSRGLQVTPNTEREICSNGLRVMNILGNMRITHRTTGMVEWFENTIANTLADLDRNFSIIPKMYEIDVKVETFNQKVEKLLGKKFSEMVHAELLNPSKDNPLYRTSAKTVSLYDAMSALTYISTHKDDITQTKRSSGARVIAQRHYKIEKLVKSYIA